MSKPHRLNVLGDFYVEEGCCLRCGVPWSIAPDLFEPTDDSCYVKRQPQTGDELEKMIKVVHAQELTCIRYQGRNKAILLELKRLGEASQCDYPSG